MAGDLGSVVICCDYTRMDKCLCKMTNYTKTEPEQAEWLGSCVAGVDYSPPPPLMETLRELLFGMMWHLVLLLYQRGESGSFLYCVPSAGLCSLPDPNAHLGKGGSFIRSTEH